MPVQTEAQRRDRERGAHLLRRFGMGASEAELDYYLQDGYKGAVERLLDPASTPEVGELDIETLRNAKGNLPMPTVVAWWTMRLLTTRRPLLEKMVVFWHNHFATGADKVKAAPMMHLQNETLRAHALGGFEDLLVAVSKDPAMLYYLDNQENVRGKPNENFAREVMELFTLGIGHYTEGDVQEAARCFTGWSLKRGGKQSEPEFLMRARLHDDGEKTVLGKTGNLGGEDVLKILCDHPQCATFLVTKLWNWFVYPNPEPATLAPFVKTFYESDLNVKTLLRAIMMSEEFHSERARRRSFKNPVDFCVVTLRQLGVGETMLGSKLGSGKPERARAGIAAGAANAMRSQGMWLMYPPDVSGWKPGEAWVTTATMIERIGWASRLFGQSAKGNIPGVRAYDLLVADPTPGGVVDRFASIGIKLSGFMPDRDEDAMGIAVAAGFTSNQYRRAYGGGRARG
ncbi:DUF1800 domain-containing protein, partial [bacterium]